MGAPNLASSRGVSLARIFATGGGGQPGKKLQSPHEPCVTWAQSHRMRRSDSGRSLRDENLLGNFHGIYLLRTQPFLFFTE